MLNIRLLLVLFCSTCLTLALALPSFSQDYPPTNPPKVTVQADGTVEVPAQSVPVSAFLSPEAKAYVTQHLKDMQNPEILKQDAGVPRFMKPYIARDYEVFAVEKKDQKIGGVHAYVYTPKAGVSARNKDQVLINLHGGGFSGCWPGCAELDSGSHRRDTFAAQVRTDGARREREHEASATVDVEGFADESTRHLAHEFLPAGEQTHIGSAER